MVICRGDAYANIVSKENNRSLSPRSSFNFKQRVSRIDKRVSGIDKRVSRIGKRVSRIDKIVSRIDKIVSRIGKRVSIIDKKVNRKSLEAMLLHKKFSKLSISNMVVNF